MDIKIKDLTKPRYRCNLCGDFTKSFLICDKCHTDFLKKHMKEVENNETPNLNVFGDAFDSLSNSILPADKLVGRKTHHGICTELNETYRKKNNDYGDSFKKSYDEFGIVSAVVRMSDKMERLKSLTSGTKKEVKDESIEDTIMDLCNYGIMTVIELRNRR